MGNPNTYPRHNSSPYRFDRRYLRLRSRLCMKKNPYVPYFRHSPPTSLRSLEASISEDPRRRTSFSVNPTTATTQPLEIPSHIRRLDNAYLKRELIDRCEQLVTILEKLPNSKRKHGSNQRSNRRLEIRKIVVDGHLRGGNRDTLSNICDASTFMNGVQKVLEDSSKESSSSTVKVLAKLGSWFLFPLAYDAASCGYRDYDYDDIKKCTFYPLDVEESDGSLGESSSDSDGDASINEEDDNSVAVSDVRDHQKPSSLDVPFDISVSEIAQAYYAHQVVDQSEYSSSEGHRLDYVITQMDIARMARNASRHLDVDSILNLPTVTYKCPNRVLQQDRASSSDPPTDKAFSFVLVEQHQKDGSDSVPNQDDMCVICLEPYKEGDRLRVLPCDHSFHVGCIDRWLSGSHSHHECFTSGCPTCKTTASQCQEVNDGSVPSWAFAQLGGALARSSSSVSAS